MINDDMMTIIKMICPFDCDSPLKIGPSLINYKENDLIHMILKEEVGTRTSDKGREPSQKTG